MRSILRGVVIGAAALTAVAAVYRLALSHRLGRWGATPEEWSDSLPGDEVVPEANHLSTRAVEIEATPAEIWPWLVQIGQGRGGMYSYTRIQNLMRLDMHNADRIVPELQNLAVCDTIPLDPKGKGPKVRELIPEERLVLYEADPPWIWTFVLRPIDAERTRLVARNRVSTRRAKLPVRLFYAVVGPPVFLMERKMLLGIKERAERLHQSADAGALSAPVS